MSDASADVEGSSSEAEVLAQLRNGDETCFRALVTELTPTLLRLARSYTATDAAAQDAVQATWLVVAEKLHSFEGRSSLKTWICGVLVHTARRTSARERRSVPFSSAWRSERAPAVDPSRFHTPRDADPTGTWSVPPVRWDEIPEERLAAKELRRVIDEAIDALPARQRQVMIARDVLGMDAAEAAALLEVSAGNERVLLHRARSRVREALEQYGVRALTDTGLGSPSRREDVT